MDGSAKYYIAESVLNAWPNSPTSSEFGQQWFMEFQNFIQLYRSLVGIEWKFHVILKLNFYYSFLTTAVQA